MVVRYPDPNIKVLDPRFAPLVLGNAAVETIATGCRFNEGPVWFGDLRCLVWSDIPNDRMMKWEEETGAVSVFRKPSNYSNGNTRDRQGRLVTCEMDAQRLTRMTVNAHAISDNLRPGVTVEAAAAICWTYSSPELYELLVIKQRWPLTRYGAFIADALIAHLLAPV